ncbi:hypothetical protein [Methanosarcina sp. UBA5]|uniref:hypothetical protein n=1 Tax=Methanosarcina sp. UBA5 TaxID=1915593 RepID=UPI0025E5AEC2|nr:hypothetical protein [Methanosarcina sp. UBA5]
MLKPGAGKTTFLELGEKEKALNVFRMLLESDPDHLNSLLSGGDLLCKFAKYGEVFKYHLRAPETQPWK